MSQINKNGPKNILFHFESYPCVCVTDIEHIASGVEPKQTYKVQSMPGPKLVFVYDIKKGFLRVASDGTIEETNILGTFLSLSNKPLQQISSFLQKNGFLFPVSPDCYEEFDAAVLQHIIDRLRITVELMTAANELHKDYPKILHLTLSLLFYRDIKIKTFSMIHEYHSCNHSYITLLQSAHCPNPELRAKINSDLCTIKDSIYSSCSFPINEYNVMRDHIFTKTGDKEPFTSVTKDALIKIAHFTIGEEINANLFGVHPMYDSDTMSPSWQIDNLLCALYFSIFHLNPSLALYRPCNNPNCGKYFLSKTTPSRTRYCSAECCNRIRQIRYREKHKLNAKKVIDSTSA